MARSNAPCHFCELTPASRVVLELLQDCETREECLLMARACGLYVMRSGSEIYICPHGKDKIGMILRDYVFVFFMLDAGLVRTRDYTYGTIPEILELAREIQS